ncbi:MAG: sn-glycerol-3-phosphate ABC transporter substrate-binding protein UgpB [Arenicellales bacterium]|jgi:sn-glycerol 3-phosphate transport system substrate-binding protein|nr:sn-glycerol-3-phosphate ABC transporter substrate-binding protein UgpB [Arenicellales bacterium]|tara:strand:- start:4307 stop:5617 length:1311 start_codon:yes stop_codon:yes gene_type:complete
MKKLKLFGLAIGFVVSGLVGTASAATEIQWWHAMGGALGEKVNIIANGFNQSQSEYQVVPVYKGNYTETMTAAIAAFRAGEQPHIVQVFEVGTASMMAAKGAVYPVHELMADANEPFDEGAYLPAVISYYTTADGKLLSLPFNSSTPVLWYNADAVEKIGVGIPRTWDELEAASRKAVAEGYKCGFSFGWQSWVMLENYSAWHNLPIGTQENGFTGFDTEFTINNEAVINRIQKIADLAKEGVFVYGGRRGDSRPMFALGECAFWMNSSAYYGGFKKDIKDFKFGQSMLPLDTAVASEPQNSIIGGATLWVLRGNDAAEYKGVAKFFSYMSTPGVQSFWHQNTGYVPITTEAYELSKKQFFYEMNPGTDTAIKQLSLNQPTANSKGLRFGSFVQIRDIFNEELEAVWSGTKDANQAINDAVARGNKLLRKFEKTVD